MSAAPDAGDAMTLMSRTLAGTSVEGSLGIRPALTESGGVRLELPLTPAMVDGSPASVAVFHAALAVLCDSGLGISVAMCRPGGGGITLDLRVDLVRDVPAGARELVLVAQGIDSGPEHGVARAAVHDDSGQLIAHATGTLVMSQAWPVRDGGPRRPALDLTTVFAGSTVDGDGCVSIPIRPETENTRGIVHGALLTAAGLSAQRAVRADGPPSRLLWFAAEFLRPVPSDIGMLRARVEPVRSGRRFRSDRIELMLPDGRSAVSVTVCTLGVA